MKDCWNGEPGLRPSFADLAEKMGEELQEGEKEHYLLLNKPYDEVNKKMEQKYVSFLPGSSTTSQSENKSEIGTKAAPSILDESTPMLENGDHLEPMPVGPLSQPSIAAESTLLKESSFTSAFGLPNSMMPKSREKRRSSSRSLYHYHKAETADGSMNTMKETISAVENIFALSAFDLSNMAENGSVGKCAKGKPEEVEMRRLTRNSSGRARDNNNPRANSVSSVSSGFHSNSSDVITHQQQHLWRPMRTLDEPPQPPPRPALEKAE